jgi:hypothetical protein
MAITPELFQMLGFFRSLGFAFAVVELGCNTDIPGSGNAARHLLGEFLYAVLVLDNNDRRKRPHAFRSGHIDSHGTVINSYALPGSLHEQPPTA